MPSPAPNGGCGPVAVAIAIEFLRDSLSADALKFDLSSILALERSSRQALALFHDAAACDGDGVDLAHLTAMSTNVDTGYLCQLASYATAAALSPPTQPSGRRATNPKLKPTAAPTFFSISVDAGAVSDDSLDVYKTFLCRAKPDARNLLVNFGELVRTAQLTFESFTAGCRNQVEEHTLPESQLANVVGKVADAEGKTAAFFTVANGSYAHTFALLRSSAQQVNKISAGKLANTWRPTIGSKFDTNWN